MVELKLDISKRFMVLASIVLIFGSVAGIGFAGQGKLNLPLSWVLDKDGNSVDVNDDGVVDNSEKVEGFSASDLMAGGSGYSSCHVEEDTDCSKGDLISIDSGSSNIPTSHVISGVIYTALENDGSTKKAGWQANGRLLDPFEIGASVGSFALCCE